MEKNSLLAIVLSVLVIVGWSWLFPPPPPVPTAPTPQQSTQNQTASTQPTPQQALPTTSETAPLPNLNLSSNQAENITIETEQYIATLSSQGGVLSSLLLKNYEHFKKNTGLANWIPQLEWVFGQSSPDFQTSQNRVEMVKKHFDIPTLGVIFPDSPELTREFNALPFYSNTSTDELKTSDFPKQVVLTSPVHRGLQVMKTLTFSADNFILNYDVAVINRSEQARPTQIRLQLGEGRIPELAKNRPIGYTHIGPMYLMEEVETTDFDELVVNDFAVPLQAKWFGLTDQYFISVAKALSPIEGGVFSAKSSSGRLVSETEAYVGANLPAVIIQPNKMVEAKFLLYYGPKNQDDMQSFGDKLELSMDLTLEVVAMPLLQLLLWIESYVHNYGIAIILLTVIVRVVLFPITYRGSKNMKRMQQLQPKITKLRDRYKDKKEKLNTEMMSLFKRNKVNPVSGCLPMLLQIPIFFGLYSALSSAVELRHEPFFLWMHDLSAPDGFGVLPVAMGVSMYFIQRMTPTGMMDPMQVKMMRLFPLIFTVFTFGFPAGLTLYWVTSNILSIGQQYVINRIKLPDAKD